MKILKRRILFVSAHPDDETLGCGGTIFKHRALGDEAYWLIMTCMREHDGWPKQKIEARKKEIIAVAKTFGFKKVFALDYPTTKLDTIPMSELMASVSRVIRDIQPALIYLPNESDVHTDHQITFKAIASCTKNFRYPSIKRILAYECLSETEFAPPLRKNAFLPNVFIDITPYLKKKIAVMKLYKGEVAAFPFPRSEENIVALARYRGATCGCKAAEAFMLLKELL